MRIAEKQPGTVFKKLNWPDKNLRKYTVNIYSQGTVIFESWYKKNTYLISVPLHPVSDLDLRCLNESEDSYSYCGYIVVDMEYPPEVAGTCQTVTILALISPSSVTADQTPVI